jgi:hypothetical protein
MLNDLKDQILCDLPLAPKKLYRNQKQQEFMQVIWSLYFKVCEDADEALTAK